MTAELCGESVTETQVRPKHRCTRLMHKYLMAASGHLQKAFKHLDRTISILVELFCY